MKYNKVKIEECASWVRLHGLQEHGGALLKDFCREMDISQETYFQWMKESEFSEAIRKAKIVFKDSIEKRLVESLANSALGYEVEEVKTEYKRDKRGEPIPIKVIKTKKHVQPNTGAGIFLLTNIAPERWKNKLNTEHSGMVEGGMTFVVKDEEEKELIKRVIDR